MKFENIEVFNFKNAIRGMRNPLESWDKSDSTWDEPINGNVCAEKGFVLGPKDLELAQKLIAAGPEHRKFMRQIIVSVDITAPLYFHKELDTYKVSTVSNSTSTMHKLATTPITMDCFEMDDYEPSLLMYEREPYDIDNYVSDIWENIIGYLETLRLRYLKTKDKRYWKELIRLLPESWLQKRTMTMNYETLLSIVHQRSGHKLVEWHAFIDDFIKTLPYSEELLLKN